MTERLSASVAGRHVACHASANLELAIPNFTVPPVDKMAGAKGVGTKRHTVFEAVNEETPSNMKHMIDALQYMYEVRTRRRFKVLTEHPMTADFLIGKPGTTADAIYYVEDEIHVLDPKTGKIPVEVIDNEQLMFYAICAAPLAPKAKGVHVHIVQPWADNMNSWFVDTNRLLDFKQELIDAEKAIRSGDLTFGPSKHCTFCPANPHKRGDGKGHPLCPAMMDLLYPDRNKIDELAILEL
jgi:hypothetical protein